MQEGSGGPLGLPVVQDFVIQKFHRYSNYVVPPGLEVRALRGSAGTDRPPRGPEGALGFSICPFFVLDALFLELMDPEMRFVVLEMRRARFSPPRAGQGGRAHDIKPNAEAVDSARRCRAS